MIDEFWVRSKRSVIKGKRANVFLASRAESSTATPSNAVSSSDSE